MRLQATHTAVSFQEVARIHAAEIHHGALPLFGERFMARLYREISCTPRAGVWVAVESGTVLGFLAGCADIKAAFRCICLKGGMALGLLAVRPVLVTPRLWRKFWALAMYPFRNQNPAAAVAEGMAPRPRAELLSMAVTRTAHRRGIGRCLVAAFEESLPGWGVTEGYWVTTNSADSDSNRFYQAMGCLRRLTVPHHDLMLHVYYREIPAKAPPGNPQ